MEKKRLFITNKFNHHRSFIAILSSVYIVIITLAVIGRILLDNTLQNYADGQIKFWAEGLMDRLVVSDNKDTSIPDAPYPFDNISFIFYQEDKKLITKLGNDNIIFNENMIRNKFAYIDTDDEVYQSKLTYFNQQLFTCFYMQKSIRGKVYSLYGSIPGDFSQNNKYFGNIIAVYNVVIILFMLVFIAMIHSLIRYTKLSVNHIKETERRIAAENIAKSKAEFLAHTTHEFRTPLNAILGMNEMIKRQTIDPQIIQYTEYIENAGNNMLSMANELLEFAKTDEDNMEVMFTEYKIQNIASYVKKTLSVQADKKNLNLLVEVTKNMPDMLIGDPEKIKHIVLNLGNNAVKYTNSGEVLIKFDYAKSSLNITVSDTGIGIDKKDIQYIFENYTRVENIESNTEGTGIGLAIVQYLTAILGGAISVTSEVGKGSTFTVTIPQQFVPQKENYLLSSYETFVAPNARILIVDDTQTNIDVLIQLLRHTQMTIDTAFSGHDALKFLQNNTYDIVFLDERMPGMSGLETFTLIKQNHLADKSKMILFTADVHGKNASLAVETGFDRFLEKPVTSIVLENTVFKLLGNKAKKIPKQAYVNSLPQQLLNNNLLNPAEGITYCGDGESYLLALKNFTDYAPEKIAELESLLNNHDYDKFRLKVHGCASSLKIIGAVSLSKMASDFEYSQDNTYIDKGFDDFVKQYNILTAQILQVLDVPTSKHKDVEIEQNAIYGIMIHLQQYVEDFNYEAVSSMMGAITQYKMPSKIKDDFDVFCKAFKDIDWVAMEDILKRIIDCSMDWKES